LDLEVTYSSSGVANSPESSGTPPETLTKERRKQAGSPIKPYLGQQPKVEVKELEVEEKA